MNLLKQFGGWDELKKATVEEIAKTKGISRALAAHIYCLLHEEV